MTLKMKTQWSYDGPERHTTVTFTLDSGLTQSKRYCGESWCGGACGFPALVLVAFPDHPDGPVALKAHSAMVACGPVWQQCRVPWTGDNEPLPEGVQQLPDLTKMMWW